MIKGVAVCGTARLGTPCVTQVGMDLLNMIVHLRLAVYVRTSTAGLVVAAFRWKRLGCAWTDCWSWRLDEPAERVLIAVIRMGVEQGAVQGYEVRVDWRP